MMSSLPALHVNDFQMIVYAHFGTIKYTKVSCGGLYDTCDSIAWTDPLQCGWCAERNSTGHTVEVGNKAACASGQLLMRQCSPVIVSVNPGKDEYTIVGEDLTNFEQVKVLVCNRDCRVKYHKSSAIQCEIENAFNCDVVVTGKVGDRNDFTLVQPSRLVDSGTSTEAVGDDANKKVSRTIRIVTAIFGSLFLLVLIVVIYFFYRRLARKRSKRRDEKQKNAYMSVSPDAIPFDDLSSFDNSSCSPMLNSTHVKVLQLVGGGFSSQVFKAIYQNGSHEETVAVKKIMNGHFEREDVMREIGLMAGCSHKNIVRFIGHYCERGDETIHIVTEFMEGGDLHKYLQNDENRPTIGLAFSYVLQLVDGMVYLTKQHIIHRDLAARNCMLDKYYQCLKITDFGLCRRSDIDYQYVSFRNGLMPFRWLALECFDENEGSHYSEKSDVWAFGVTVWEIFTRGNPYENMGVFDVQRHLREGQRLPLDTYTCPEELKDVLLQCWAEYPDQRPSFKQLKDLVTNIYDGLKHNSEYMQQQYEVPKSVKDATSPSQSMPPTPMADTTV
ncbi:TK/Met protein kinase [Aphelenchoides avenae]|nr:TK/Met protein kinase [Aphelenchus avenae]